MFYDPLNNFGNEDNQMKQKVCKSAMPMGVTRGNVFHNNGRFGWYANQAFTTKVLTAANGEVGDWRTCTLWDMESGEDLSQPFVVENHVEYFEQFAFGAYDCGDVTVKDSIIAFSTQGLYWKSYRRGLASGPFCQNCTIYKNHIPVCYSES